MDDITVTFTHTEAKYVLMFVNTSLSDLQEEGDSLNHLYNSERTKELLDSLEAARKKLLKLLHPDWRFDEAEGSD